MNKKLFTQIKNEWRGNTWLAIKLLVVSVVMWFIRYSLCPFRHLLGTPWLRHQPLLPDRNEYAQ